MLKPGLHEGALVSLTGTGPLTEVIEKKQGGPCCFCENRNMYENPKFTKIENVMKISFFKKIG